MAVSPDGRRVAFVATAEGKSGWMVWVRDLNSLTAHQLPGTEGESGDPFWSPDSRSIAFMAGGKLKRIDLSGGPAVSLCDALGSVGGAWSKNDVILLSPKADGALFRIPASGGSLTPVTTLDKKLSESSHRGPSFLPDGHRFLYTAYTAEEEKSTVYVGDLDSKDDLKTRRRVLTANSNVIYTPPGYLLFMREQTLMAQPFDPDKAVTTGDPVPVAEQVDYASSYSQGTFSSSENGVLAYFSGTLGANGPLTWIDRSGKPLGTVAEAGVDAGLPAISPDGSTVAYGRFDSQAGSREIWLHDLVRGGESRFTFNSKVNLSPVWSPEGNSIAFSSNRDGAVYTPYRKAVHGASAEETLGSDGQTTMTDDWSRDGHYLLESKLNPRTSNFSMWILPLVSDKPGGQKPYPCLRSEFRMGNARLSPNGQWLAYQSDETKRFEVYVGAFPDSAGGKWQVSINGGTLPHWSRDGKELYFISPDGKMMEVDVKAGPGFQISTPKPLFGGVQNAAGYDVSKDGRFLVAVRLPLSSKGTMNVIVNWSAGLKN